MKRRVPRGRNYLPTLVQLESRRPLTVAVTWKGQDGVDLVGTDASVGPDGVQDIHLQLSQLTGGTPRSILIQGPKGFQWAYGPNLTGAANAEFFSPGDLYLNPTIRSNLDQNGNPLGSSTGALVTLHSGNRLNLTVTYQNGSTDSGPVTVSKLASPPLPMSKPATPANVISGDFAVSNYGQDNTGPQGDVHLKVTGLAGRVISTATLSDQAGAYWASPDPTDQHSLWPVQEASDNQSADLYFAPVRDETVSIPGVSTNSDMMLRLTFQNDTRQHVTQFAGGPWDPSRVANPLNGNSVSNVDSESALAAALGNPPPGSPEIDTIALAPNAQIVVTHPLQITHSVKIIGQNATLTFEQGDAPWPATATGALYVTNSYQNNIIIDFENFTINFDQTAPLQWFDPANPTNYFDPENSNYGTLAIINTHWNNDNRNREFLTLSGMTIDGPPAFDPPRSNPDSFHVYVGELAIPLVFTGNDSGSITNCHFQGGPVQVSGGPWVVTGNDHYGALANTFAPSAFGFNGPHDLTLDSNVVSQQDSNGHVFRLLILANAGFNDRISNNTFGGGGGQVGNEVTYSTGTQQYVGINDPEVMLTETNRIFFEGTPGALSSDGRILVLPMVSSTTASRAFIDSTTGPGMVVSILSVRNSDGTPNPLAGRWFRIAQQISSAPVTFLMKDPLPAGSYAISIVPGFVDESFISNSVDLSTKSSTALNLAGANFGTLVQGNNFTGGSNYVYPYTGNSVDLSAYATNPDNSSTFPIPSQWTHNPSYDVTIQGNTIINSVGGVILDVHHDGTQKSETGRRYLTATVANNQFEWTQDFLNSWDTEFHQILNGSNNLANVYYDSSGNVYSDSSIPPTVTVGAGFSANGGDRAPWTVNIPPNYQVDPSHPLRFVDPVELSVTVTGNSASTPEPTGQVYAGFVNGVAYTSFPYTSYTAPIGNAISTYVKYNAKNLTIS